MCWRVFGGKKTPSKLTLKTKWYRSCGCCHNSWSCEQLKERVTDKYFEKKIRIWTQINPSVTGKVCYHYNNWVTGVYMVCKFYGNSRGKTSQIEWLLESNLRSFGCFKCSLVSWLSLNTSWKRNLLTRIGWVLQSQVAFKS